METPRAPLFSEAFILTLALLLAALHAIMGVTATVGKSVTSDEIAHLTAGYIYNRHNDYRLQPENGNLPQRWAALPMQILSPHLPPLSEHWRKADVWSFSHAFFYDSSNDTDFLLFAGRMMIALFGAGTGLMVFFWSRELFGSGAALFSFALFVFCPNFLAHDALATSDATMVFFMLAFIRAWWAQLQRLSWMRWGLSAVLFALACVAKFSAVLLLPMMGLMAAARLLQGDPLPLSCGRSAPLRRHQAVWILLSGLGHMLVAWVVIWAFFGFRYSAFAAGLPSPEHDFNRPWDWVLPHLGNMATLFQAARAWHVLPEAFLYGFAFVLDFAQQRGAFLNGNYSIRGWWQFFPIAFLLKTPVPLLLLMVAGLARWGSHMKQAWTRHPSMSALTAGTYRIVPLLILFVVYSYFSLTSHLNIGHRHILPLYPVIFILLGGLAAGLGGAGTAFRATIVGGLLIWVVIESVRIRPHYLAYFNQLAGGPAEGYRHLVDSSLDWGQDLPGLSAWLAQHNAAPREPVFLSYFGTGDPAYEGIHAVLLPCLPTPPVPPPWNWLTPGYYCLSATMLQQVYSPVRGPWTLERERDYLQLRATDPLFRAYSTDKNKRRELNTQLTDEEWHRVWDRFEKLRFARLCQYLRVRGPDGMVGYSILIYKLSPSELDAVVNGTTDEFTRAIEQAVATHGKR